MNASGGSGSSIPELIRGQIDTTQEISGKGLDHSSILECLRSKTDELLQCQEQAIVLQSQLKIAKETAGLQEAEFAFERAQYEADIDHMKQREQELLAQIAKLQSEKLSSQKYDVEVQLEETRHANAEAEKWKSQARKHRRELKHLAKENIALKLEIDQLKQKLQEAAEWKSQLDDSKCEIANLQQSSEELRGKKASLIQQVQDLQTELREAKAAMEKLRRELSDTPALRTRNSELEAQLSDAKARIRKQKARLTDTDNEQKGMASCSMDFNSQLRSLEDENMEIRGHAHSARKQLKSALQEIEQQRTLLERAENEHDALADILGIESENFGDKWTAMNQKIEAMMMEMEQIDDLKSENEKLQKRLNFALEESRNKQPSASSQENTEQQSNLDLNLKRARNELEETKKMLTALKFQRKLGHPIEMLMVSLSRQILDLHSCICNRPSVSLRPIVLFIIFLHRLTSRRPTELSLRSIEMFSGHPTMSSEIRMKDIREKFAELSHDLIIAKQTILEMTANLQTVVEERDIAQLTLRSNSDEMKINRKKMALVRARMNELQSELSSLVSPDSYELVCERLKVSQALAAELESKIRDFEKEMTSRTVLERHLRSETEKLQLVTEQQTTMIDELRTEASNRELEVEGMAALLREKTKEILVLERLVHRHEEQQSSTLVSMARLAHENKELQEGDDAGTSPAGLPSGSPSQPLINTAFLGQ
jgi:chromosome segregation ATPase